MASYMQRSFGSTGRRIILALLISAVLVSSVSAAVLLYGRTKDVRAAATPTDVILLHGINLFGNSVNCDNTWNTTINYLKSQGWAGSLLALNYYRDDTTCSNAVTDTLYQYNENGTWGTTGGCRNVGRPDNLDMNEGTTSEDIERLGCKLDWFIYNLYTKYGKPVMLVSHSMGGLIARWGLYKSGQNVGGQDSRYPSGGLWVPAIVTMATPHQGTYSAGVIACGNCWEANEMVDTPSDPTNLIELLKPATSPQGGQGQTGWLTMAMNGSSCDPNAKQIYTAPDVVPDTIGATMSQAYQIAYVNPCYGHGGYLIDPDQTESAVASWCGGCALGGTMVNSSGYRHSLNSDYTFLYIHIPGGPGYLSSSTRGMYWTPSTGTHDVEDGIFTRYQQLGGPLGGVGFPTTDPTTAYDSNGSAIGTYSIFNGSSCFSSNGNGIYSSTHGTYSIAGCIYQKYGSLGMSRSALNMPVSDVQTISGGYVAYFAGSGCGATYNSAIYAGSPGTYEVQGCIYAKYQGMGGPGYFGFPTGDQVNVSGGQASYFQGPGCNTPGSGIFYSSTTGAHEVHGCIYQEYRSVGGANGFLGLPTSDEFAIPGGRENTFAGSCPGGAGYGSVIQWSSSTGAHEIRGCIYQKWVNLNRGGLSLGYPTTDLQNISGGQVQYFQGPGCGTGGSAIYSSSPGIFEVHGCIYQKYINWGGPGGVLGFPTSDEQGIASGRVNYFQGGGVYWSSATGAHEVDGRIYNKYLGLNGPSGVLGFPISDIYAVSSGWESDYQNGSIVWYTADGRVIAYY